LSFPKGQYPALPPLSAVSTRQCCKVCGCWPSRVSPSPGSVHIVRFCEHRPNWIIGRNLGPMAAKDVIGFAAQQQVIGFVQGAHQTHDCATSLSITKIRDAAAEVEPSLVSSWAAPGPCMTAIERHSCGCYDFPHSPSVGLCCSGSSGLCFRNRWRPDRSVGFFGPSASERPHLNRIIKRPHLDRRPAS
jgi:hypothetical protein